MRLFLIVILCLVSGIFPGVIDNETLIYHWDDHHGRFYYCQFGTQKEIELNRNYEPQCFSRNKGMQHILPSGVKTFPYLAYGSTAGFILKCRDIPNTDLINCNKYVYTQCKYTCKSSDLVQEIKCELKGPKENITAEWSVADPCPETSLNQSLPLGTTDIPTTSGTTIKEEYITDPSANQSTASPVTHAITTTTTALMAPSTDPSANQSTASPVTHAVTTTTTALMAPSTEAHLIAAYTVVAVVVVAFAILLLVMFLRNKQKKQKRLKFHYNSAAENIREIQLPLCNASANENLEEDGPHDTRVKEVVRLALPAPSAPEEVNSEYSAPLISPSEIQESNISEIGHRSRTKPTLFEDELGMYENLSAVYSASPLPPLTAAPDGANSELRASPLPLTAAPDGANSELRAIPLPAHDDFSSNYRAPVLSNAATQEFNISILDTPLPSMGNQAFVKCIEPLSAFTEDNQSQALSQASSSPSMENQDMNNSNPDKELQVGLSEFVPPDLDGFIKLNSNSDIGTDYLLKILGPSASLHSGFSSLPLGNKFLDEDKGIIPQG